jgi:hypothetical protein
VSRRRAARMSSLLMPFIITLPSLMLYSNRS